MSLPWPAQIPEPEWTGTPLEVARKLVAFLEAVCRVSPDVSHQDALAGARALLQALER